MKDAISRLLTDVILEIGGGEIVGAVSLADNPGHGEYTSSAALKLAKILKKSPMAIALQVAEIINTRVSSFEIREGDQNSDKIDQTSVREIPDNDVLRDVDHVEAVAPGFLNVFLTEAKLSSQITKVLNESETYGTANSRFEIRDLRFGKAKNTTADSDISSNSQTSNLEPRTSKRIIVEYTDPNPFKELHVGHLYSNAVGESMSRLLESQGVTVKRSDYFGDVGMHVAKSLWGIMADFGIENGGSESESLKIAQAKLDDLAKLPLPDRAHYLGLRYAAGATVYEENKAVAEDMKDLNYLIYMAGQEMHREENDWAPRVDYAKYIKGRKYALSVVSLLYRTGRKWSLEYFETIFRRLGTRFDFYHPESLVGEIGFEIVHEGLKSGVFEASDGAVIYQGEKKGLHTRVFINSLGLPTYEAKELGLAVRKNEDFPYDHSYIVTGNEIDEYFKVLMSALSDMRPELAVKNTHIGHGMLRLPEGKMSSRTGKVLTGEWLLEETKKYVNQLIVNNESKYTKEEQELISEKAAIAAIKYSMLRVALPSDLIFDFEKSVTFDGDSGPYLLYTYARARSVIRKAEGSGVTLESKVDSEIGGTNQKMNSEEHAIARLIVHYPDVVAEAAGNLSPNTLCTYLFQLAQAFNLFYQKHEILGKPKVDNNQPLTMNYEPPTINQFRLALTAASAQVLKNGLSLLGIETVERM